jgi:hypothetical protein
VAEKGLIEQLESDAPHSAAADGHAMELEDALMNSDLVLEYEIIDDMATDAGDKSLSRQAHRKFINSLTLDRTSLFIRDFG